VVVLDKSRVEITGMTLALVIDSWVEDTEGRVVDVEGWLLVPYTGLGEEGIEVVVDMLISFGESV
jgi:hypothetical protein